MRTSNFEVHNESMHGTNIISSILFHVMKDGKVWVKIFINTFTNYKIYISVLTGHELEQNP
jgi:hypothetical protein